MKLKRILYTAAFATMGLSLNSCSDYLDVSKELSQNLDKEQVFSNWNYMKQWYGAIYATMPNYSETGLDVTNNPNYTNVWALYSGELVCAHPNPLSVATSTFTPNSTGSYNRWWRCYQAIRQAMIFLENCPESIGDPGDRTGNYIPPEEMRRYKADVIYLLAYNYFQLFELYGPTPIIEEIADPGVSVDYARASVDEMVNHIDSLLAQLIEGDYSDALPDTYILSSDPTNGNTYDYTNMLRPTKATAMALRARLWVYAASPLFNGGYAEALQLTNKDGKRLFPDYDASKWQTAKKHLETLLDFTAANGMKLYQAYKTVEEDGETVTVPGLTEGAHTFCRSRLEEKYMFVLSAVKGLPRVMRYSNCPEGAPWILARGHGSRYEGATLDSAERLLVMAVALGIVRVMKPSCDSCDVPNVVIDDERLRKMEMMQPKHSRRFSLLNW